MTDTRRRVKVYTLNEDRQWDDRGTGHISYSHVDRLNTTLVVRAEQDSSLLLESKILLDTAYQKQQETLIVWSETEQEHPEKESTDLALSFQEKAGCDEIWEQICQVQGKDPSVNITQDIVDDGDEDDRIDGNSDVGAASAEPIELPPCELSQTSEISELFTSCLSSMPRREKLAIAVETEDYLTKLLNLFRMCEDLEHIDGLHRLHEIFKTLFLLNKNSLFEIMLDEKHIMDVVGCLEYDPSVPEPIKHREYLLNKAKFREVLTINNEKLKQKIHQTFRVQYIQEVILPTPTVFEENMLSTLNSFIFFNKVEIVNMIQEDENFLRSLFDQLLDDSKNEERRIELAGFLRELCSYSQTLQIAKRYEFLRTLADLGVLPVVESLLQTDNRNLKQLAVDVFAHVVEHNPSMVREYAHREMEESRNAINTNGKDCEDDTLLINLAIEQMICDPDPELSGAMQLMSLIRILLDPENMMASKNEKTEFLSFFYSHCIHVLMAPLLANTTEDKPAKDDYQTAHLLSIILELITFSVEHHTYQVKNYILNKDLLRRILILLKSKHSFLALAALRFLRKIISMMDEFYHRYIVKGNLFQPVVDALFKSGRRYNLLNSAALELFEFIRSEDIKALINHIEEKHMEILSKINYVNTFNGIHQRYEQQKDRDTNKINIGLENSFNQSRFRRDARTMEEEEEMWFEGEDEAEDDLISKLDGDSQTINIDKILEDKPKEDRPEIVGSSFASTGYSAEVKTKASADSTTGELNDTDPPLVNGNGTTTPPPSEVTNGSTGDKAEPIVIVKPGMVGLVDYSDDDSEEDDDDEKNKKESIKEEVKVSDSTSVVSNDTEPARKKPRMSEITKSN